MNDRDPPRVADSGATRFSAPTARSYHNTPSSFKFRRRNMELTELKERTALQQLLATISHRCRRGCPFHFNVAPVYPPEEAALSMRGGSCSLQLLLCPGKN